MAFSPDSGLNKDGTAVVVAFTTVELGEETAGVVEFDDEDEPPHEVRAIRAMTGAKRFNMMRWSLIPDRSHDFVTAVVTVRTSK